MAGTRALGGQGCMLGGKARAACLLTVAWSPKSTASTSGSQQRLGEAGVDDEHDARRLGHARDLWPPSGAGERGWASTGPGRCLDLVWRGLPEVSVFGVSHFSPFYITCSKVVNVGRAAPIIYHRQ